MIDILAKEDMVKRLRVLVEAEVQIPNDLARSLLTTLEATMDRQDRLGRRDYHIRRAAFLLDGSLWLRARALAKEASALDRTWGWQHHKAPAAMTVRGELHAAKLLHKLPGGARQFYNIIHR